MIKSENFINIQGWMVKDLGLKGNELIIYAIIFGFSQDGTSKFAGSLNYLAEWTNSTKQGVLKALKSLVEKGLILKNDVVKNGIKYCEYSLILLNKVEGGVKQSLTGYSTKFNGGIKQSLPNSINNNIEDNKQNNIYIVDFENFYSLYPRKEAKQKALQAYLKAIKKVDKDTLLEGLKKYIDYIKTNKKEREFIKHPATWLNQGCWEDEYSKITQFADKNSLIQLIKEA